MCGIFGAIRVSPKHGVADVFRALGKGSEERGRDSAGAAMLLAEKGRFDATSPDATTLRSPATMLDAVSVIKGSGLFSALDFTIAETVVEESTVFLGHTRAATQGAISDLANASPMYVGALVGTHNGDIDTSSIPQRGVLRQKALGQTDTELLYLALNAVRNDRRRMTRVLRAVRGRAALAFIDRGRPDRLYLARSALSPLCYAHDQYGNFYYASNPDWFRRVQKSVPGVIFTDATLIPEGHFLTVNTLTGTVLDVRRFTPTCRESDLRLLSTAVYRGFDDRDKHIDMSLHRHQVAQRLGSWPELTRLSVKRTEPSVATPFSGSPSSAANSAFAPDPLDMLPVTENGIDIDEAERLCWTGSEFDFITFEALLTLDTDEANQMMETLRSRSY